ncbi:uncharacterized protein LOC108959289 [Eucalyptus grandis]|uniref:uncharacterized protein LOC108959289 n=1 Tax=Eucalyptus grandis TaxID=71139 RepID=UPI00192EBB53|nr:uncharacterized protein LOC108959289 [Eucalyptus grandis]
MASSSNPVSHLGRAKEKLPIGARHSRSRFRSASRGNSSTQPGAKNRNDSKTAPAKSWVNVAKLSARGYDLEYVPPTSIGKKAIVHLTEDVIHAADPKWYNCLVGYYVGKSISYKTTESVLRETWGTHLTEMLANDEGFFFFIIPDHEYRQKILEGGPLTVARVPLVLKQWHPTLELKKELQSSIPVWIRMKNIPFAYWVCVEISAKLERCESVEVFLDEESFTVPIFYEWRPNSCPKCCVFGHNCLENETSNVTGDGPGATTAAEHPSTSHLSPPIQPPNAVPGGQNGWK